MAIVRSFVLGERVVAEAAGSLERTSSERTEGAGNRRDATQRVVEAPVVVEADDVFDVLSPAEEPTPVADLDVAGDRADRGIG
jgi:hypothetical protein